LFGADVADISPAVNRASPSYRKLHRLGGCATKPMPKLETLNPYHNLKERL
jgi:hypothetical protein